MQINPFHRFLTKEDHLHHGILTFSRMQYPARLVMHCPNEGKRTPFERYRASFLGIKAGWPDLIWLEPMKGYMGLAMEVKVIYERGKKNKLSKAQKAKLAELYDRGWFTCVVYDLESAIQIIASYFDPRIQEIDILLCEN